MSSFGSRRPLRRLDQYDLLEVLGTGSTGVVYRAWHARMAAPVAVKLLHPHLANRPGLVERFRTEMAAHGRLHHPNIVTVTDGGEVDGEQFLVMELVEGMGLLDLAERVGPLPVREACAVCRQAALALCELERQRLVHRDIKPGNLILAVDGRVCILDFGLVRCLAETALPEATPTGQLIGSVDYLAPEQAVRASSVDSRADVYSLGCTLYRLLTGQVPYGGQRYAEVGQKIEAHTTAPFPEPTRADLSPHLRDVLRRMTAKDRRSRPGPAEVVVLLQEPSTGANLPALLADARLRPNRGDLRSEVSTPVEPQPTTGTTRPPPRRREWVLAGLFSLLVVLAVALAWLPVSERPPMTLFDLDTLPAGVTHKLLELDPPPVVETIWTQRPNEGDFLLPRLANPRLFVDSPGKACFLFGTTQATTYTLTLDLEQTILTGGLQVVLGYHDSKSPPGTDPDRAHHFQFQYFETHVGQNRATGAKFAYLARGIRSVRDKPNHKYGKHFGATQDYAVAGITGLHTRLTLTVRVERGLLKFVKVTPPGGQEESLDRLLTLPRLEQALANPIWTKGGIGFALDGASGTVRNVLFKREQ